MTTPRIDTLRNQLAATGTLLADTRRLLDLLHELAYNRTRATDQVKVAGGTRDYALDTHGDPRARAAYKALARAVDHTCVHLATAAHDTLRILNDGESPGTNRHHPATIDVIEHAELIDRQRRRIQAGEPDIRTLAQPKQAGADRAMARKIRSLEAENARLRRRLADYGDRIA